MIKQKNIVIKTTSITLTYAEMGDIVCNSSSDITITLPAPNAGLWFRISNAGSGVVTVYYSSTLTTLKQTEQCLCLANATSNWFFSKGGGGETYTLPQATETTLGGVKAKVKTIETVEVAIDTETGKLYSNAPDAAENGIPTGGTAGQILSKIDSGDYNVQWIDAPSGGNSIDLALTKTYSKTTPATAYPDTNATELTDGRKADNTTFSNVRFVGWQNMNVEVVIDLSSLVSVKRCCLFGLSDKVNGIYIPLSVEILTSTDNINFTSKTIVNPTLTEGLYLYTINADFTATTARYVKFAIARQTVSTWIFLDELEVW
jgi:hypothetical protein